MGEGALPKTSWGGKLAIQLSNSKSLSFHYLVYRRRKQGILKENQKRHIQYVSQKYTCLYTTKCNAVCTNKFILRHGFDGGGGDFWGKTDGTAKGFCTRVQRAKQNKSCRAGVPGFLWRSLILVQYNTGSIMIGHYFYRDERRNTKNDFTLQNHTAKTNKGINLA